MVWISFVMEDMQIFVQTCMIIDHKSKCTIMTDVD